MSSFKSNENVHKKEDGSYYVVSANEANMSPQYIWFTKVEKVTKILHSH